MRELYREQIAGACKNHTGRQGCDKSEASRLQYPASLSCSEIGREDRLDRLGDTVRYRYDDTGGIADDAVYNDTNISDLKEELTVKQ